MLEKIPESPLRSKEIKPINLKGNQPWILIGRTDTEAEAPVFCSPDANSRLIGKVPDTGKDWGQEKRASEDEMPGWHHQCNGHELGKTLGDGEGQGVLACCSPWGRRIRHDQVTEQQHTIFYLFTHQFLVIWIVFTFWPLWIMLLWTFVYKYLCGCIFCFSWAYIWEWNGLLIWYVCF